MAFVFLHLQKCAGGTINALLRSSFPDDRFSKRTIAGHIDWKENNGKGDRIICGHITAREIAHNIGNTRVFTVLREPEARLLSHFYFLKSHTIDSLKKYNVELLFRIKSMSLYEFLCDREVDNWLRDFYVWNLDSDFKRGKTPPDLNRASKFLESCELVGITEELEAFVEALFKALNLPLPTDIPRVHSLEGRSKNASFDPVEIRSPTDEERALIDEYIQNDRVLYNLAKTKAPKARSNTGLIDEMKALLKRYIGPA